jgi:ABC-type lipoprotein release transport system permease subunit
MLLQIAFRDLFASRVKTLIVGGIILFGAVLVVVGSSLVDTVDAGMRASIQGSLAGHVQVYDARSRDPLALYGSMMGDPDLTPFPDFARVKAAIATVPGVRQVVPMGLGTALVSPGNLFDVAVARLRADVRARAAGRGGPELEARYQAHQAHVRRMATLLRDDLLQATAILDASRESAERARNAEDLARATSSGFWEELDRHPLSSLEFLENRIAPLALEGTLIVIRYVGTDLEQFRKAFDRMEIVEGRLPPPGERGLLVGKLYAEEYLKLRAARRLDQLQEAITLHHRKIAGDEELARWVKEAGGQTRELLMQLDPLQAAEAARRLGRALGTGEDDLGKLLAQLFALDDRNFSARYRIFYDELAPLLQLYPFKVGDAVTVQGAARSGYMKSVNLKVWGLVQFKGLEKSGFAGVMSVMDLASFRELYGWLGPKELAEIRGLKAAAGAKELSREEAEATLFGGETSKEHPEAGAPGHPLPLSREAREGQGGGADLAPSDPDQGVALNAAVILDDPRRIPAAMRQIEAAGTRAGLHLKAVTWQEAAGMVGQFVTLARLVLYVAVLIIFAVALVIINNALVMATLQRVTEIGTMRAIGAQRRFIWAMVLVESVAVGVAFGLAGSALGAGVVWLIRAAGGIPAGSDRMYFFFSGPSLLPRLGAGSLAISLGIVLLVSVVSGLYPALIATRVTPLEAMRSED